MTKLFACECAIQSGRLDLALQHAFGALDTAKHPAARDAILSLIHAINRKAKS